MNLRKLQVIFIPLLAYKSDYIMNILTNKIIENRLTSVPTIMQNSAC